MRTCGENWTYQNVYNVNLPSEILDRPGLYYSLDRLVRSVSQASKDQEKRELCGFYSVLAGTTTLAVEHCLPPSRAVRSTDEHLPKSDLCYAYGQGV